MEQEHAFHAGFGQPFQHIKRIAMMDAHVGETTIAHRHQRADHAIHERFRTDQAHIGAHRRLPGHMLALAKADFQPQRAIIAKQGGRRDRAFGWHRNARQQIGKQFGLALAQGMALPAAVKAADGGRIGNPRIADCVAHGGGHARLRACGKGQAWPLIQIKAPGCRRPETAIQIWEDR